MRQICILIAQNLAKKKGRIIHVVLFLAAQPASFRFVFTGEIQLIPPVLSTETLLHILLSSEYSGFRPSTTAVVIIGAPISVPTGPTDRR